MLEILDKKKNADFDVLLAPDSIVSTTPLTNNTDKTIEHSCIPSLKNSIIISPNSNVNLCQRTPKSTVKMSKIKRKRSLCVPSKKRIRFEDQVNDIIEHYEDGAENTSADDQLVDQSLILSERDLCVLRGNEWLNDKHIQDTALVILKKQFPDIRGMQNTHNIPISMKT